MKYIIDIEDKYTKDWVNETPMCKELCIPISVPNRQRTYHVITGFKLEPYIEPDRKAIEDEVWEFVRELIHCNNGKGMTDDELQSCFGYDLYSQVFKQLSYQDVKAKYDAWKKEKEEIHVGDEVKFGSRSGVVVRIDTEPKDSGVNVVCREGNTAYIGMADVTKTGRHFDEVEKLLERMKAE